MEMEKNMKIEEKAEDEDEGKVDQLERHGENPTPLYCVTSSLQLPNQPYSGPGNLAEHQQQGGRATHRIREPDDIAERLPTLPYPQANTAADKS